MKSRFFVFFLTLFLATTKQALATESFVTIVHPIRGRELWLEKSSKLLEDQIRLSTEHNLETTWLVQYDALVDEEIVAVLKKLPPNHEIGLFLEVSERLATEAFVPYTIGRGNWTRPDKVFFSGYTIEQRYRLADRLIRTFEATFGYRPKSVGAWYIDAPTLSYLHEKYGITAALTCADQYSTDAYEIWGKYFGVPYYPSKNNTLMPAQTRANTLDVVTIQWALRDPLRSYGPSVLESTYSLQANDYAGHHRLGTEYFKKLFDVYANTLNPVLQVTIGIEVGMEPQFLTELKEQIDLIATHSQEGKVKVVTMSDFAYWFRQHIDVNKSFAIASQDLLEEDSWAMWWMTAFYRVGLLLENDQLILRDLKLYDEEFAAIDESFPDRREVLYRSVPSLIDGVTTKNEQVLVDRVESITTEQFDDHLIIHVGDIDILLAKDSITLADTLIFDRKNYHPIPKSGKWRLMKLLTPLFRLSDSEILSSFLRYSRINASFIAGVEAGKDTILGFKLNPLSVGQFPFPFQTLVRFKHFPPRLNLQRFYLSDADFEAHSFLADYKEDNISILPRGFLSLAEIESREHSGGRRLFENEAFQVWKSK